MRVRRGLAWAAMAGALVIGAFGVASLILDEPERLHGGGEITLEHVATVSDSARPGMLPTRTLYLEQDSRGRLIAAAATLDHVVVFDSSGRYLASVGGRGSGPGEFERISYPVLGSGDTIFVHDYFLGRLTVVDPELEIVRTIPDVLHPPELVREGRFVVARPILTEREIGYPIHLMSVTGEILRSFGTDTPEHQPDRRWHTTRVVGPGADGSVWAAAPGRYVLDRWDPGTGERLGSVRVRSDWFVGAPGPSDDPTRPPDPILHSLFEDERGLLWVLVRDRARGWEAPRPSEIDTGVEQRVTHESYDRRHDWVLEVVDPTSGRVVAARRFESAPWLNPRSGLVATLRPLERHPDAHVTFDVWRLHLQPTE